MNITNSQHAKLRVFSGPIPVRCFGLVALSLILFAGCSDLGISTVEAKTVSSNGDQPEDKTGKLTLHRKTVIDKTKRNMVSHTIFVPENWKMEGVTQWPQRAIFRIMPSPKIIVSSPGGLEAAIHHTALFSDPRPSREFMNAYGIRRPKEYTSDGGYPIHYRPDSLREWKTYFEDIVIPQRHPNASRIRVSKVSEIKQFSESLLARAKPTVENVKTLNQQARSFGLSDEYNFAVSGLMIEATFKEKGITKEFVALAGLHSQELKMQNMTQVNWSVEPNLSFVAPKGQLDANLPVLFAITGSMRPTNPWVHEVQKYVREINRIGSPVKPTSQNSVNVGNTFSEILDISHNGFRKREGIRDASQSKYVNGIHEVADYSYGGTSYHLPAGYDHVYTDDFDTIVLTNDSLFDPNVELKSTRSWTKMSDELGAGHSARRPW